MNQQIMGLIDHQVMVALPGVDTFVGLVVAVITLTPMGTKYT